MARIILAEEEKQFLNLEQELKRLNTVKAGLIRETNEVAAKNSKLKEEQIALEKKAKEIIETAKRTAKDIEDRARAVEAKANSKEAEVGTKIAELDDLQKQAKDLIKSNENREKNLIAEKEDAKKIKEKLSNALGSIKKALE